MENVFLGCFLFGAIFTLATTLLGAVGPEGGDLGAVGKLGKLGKVGKLGKLNAELEVPHDVAHLAEGPSLLSFLNLSSLVAFTTWFGAAGYLLMKGLAWSALAAVPVAVVGGVAGGGAIALFLAKVREGDRPMRAEDYRLEGTVARVSVSIPENGVGEIVFSLAGTRRSEAARGEDGRAIPDDAEVLILGYERGVATVQSMQALLTDEDRLPALERPASSTQSPTQE